MPEEHGQDRGLDQAGGWGRLLISDFLGTSRIWTTGLIQAHFFLLRASGSQMGRM